MSRFTRFTAALMLLAFGWRVSAAFISPCSYDDAAPAAVAQAEVTANHGGDGCCPGKASESASPVDDNDVPDDGDCNCPIHCGDCCDGAVMHALPTGMPTVVLGFAELIELPATSRSSARSNAEPRGILHVPRMS